MSSTASILRPALSRREHHRLAAALTIAGLQGVEMPLLTETYPELNDADALGIQALVLEERLAAGETLTAVVTLQAGDERHLAFVTDAMVREVPAHAGVRCCALALPSGLPEDLATAEDVLIAATAAHDARLVLRSRFGAGARAVDRLADNHGVEVLELGAVAPVALCGGGRDRALTLQSAFGTDVQSALLATARGLAASGRVLGAGSCVVLMDVARPTG